MTSSFTTSVAQVDGRVHVRESHTDDVGKVHILVYISVSSADFTAFTAARAIWLAAQLKAREAERMFAALAVNAAGYAFVYNTATELAAAFRLEYLTSKSRRCAELARWLLDGIDGGFLGDTAVRNAFGLSVTNWNTLKTKMGVLRTKLNDIEASVGE